MPTDESSAPIDPVQAIFQAIGHASVCWENPGGAGVFDEKQATQVASDLIDQLLALGVVFP
jgi:hypothetical protein